MATEKRLIDANAFLNEIKERHDDIMQDPIVDKATKWRESVCFGGVVNVLVKMPTVDAAPVVHGRWEDIYNGRYANPRFRCSVCKTKALYVAVQTALGNWRDEQDLSNYCPNCGAKMDGDGDV